MKHPIGQTRNGIPVYVDLIRSPAALHIAQHPHLLTLVKETIQNMSATGPEIRSEHDIGRNIGHDFVVNTNEKDVILYARLLREEIYTRFVKNGRPESTQHLSIVLHRDKNDEYELHDAWIGRINPPRPGSAEETAASRPYWSNHAFVLNNQPIQVRTITKKCPY